MYRIAIITDLPILSAGVRKLASDDGGAPIVSAVTSIEELRSSAGPYDLVVLDLAECGEAPLAAVAAAAAAGPTVVISVWAELPTLLATVRAGARGCVSRTGDESDVDEAMRVVARGGFYLPSKLADQFRLELARSESS